MNLVEIRSEKAPTITISNTDNNTDNRTLKKRNNEFAGKFIFGTGSSSKKSSEFNNCL
jgi:hypothetical protein